MGRIKQGVRKKYHKVSFSLRMIRWLDNLYCEYCNKHLKFEETTLDHLRPIGKGGGNSIYNLLLSCQECNTHKGKKLLLNFLWLRIQLDLQGVGTELKSITT